MVRILGRNRLTWCLTMYFVNTVMNGLTRAKTFDQLLDGDPASCSFLLLISLLKCYFLPFVLK
jgi:hypothetical protein